ncbi:hypothetical protein PYW07_010608 [Mythimna separata]|uniref:Peptidase S1 domain-containing protein n=1 Tax=Mythimna separata TaxID=271217 RepID=A0AAD7YAG2_MYTSE|nr:hypothetical protein PYW07_010608 [Mythimna separata]
MDKFLYLYLIVFCVTQTDSLYAEGTNITRNGQPASENQFSYMVSLQRLSLIHDDTRGHGCGGALVTLQHAVTAAACTIAAFDGENITLINRDQFRVFAGSALLTNDNDDRVRRIANIVIHPEFNLTNSRFFNDIGVIILGIPFLSSTVAPLTVKDIGTTEHVRCTTLGWGRNNTQLMHARMTAPNVTMCSILLSLTRNTMCGLPFSDLGCPGDQGSPLICYDSLVGILINTRGCTANTPVAQLFIRVSHYASWIDSVIALPVPELGPEPPTVPPPTTTTPAPGVASTAQPGVTLLAVVVIALMGLLPG